jgi:predicted aspartyl protease
MRRAVLALIAALALAPVCAPRAQDRAPAAAHAMPFQFVLERQIVFPITIDGKPAEAWLDSGAGAIVVDAAFARRLGLELGAPIKAHGVSGEVADVHLSKADLVAGDLAMPARRVVVMDLSAVQRLVGRPVQVLLGRDVFDQAVVQLDFQARKLTLTPRDAFEPPPGAPLPLKRSGDLKSVAIRVAGVEMPAILDLGNAGGLLIDQEFAAHYRLLDGRRASTTLGVGADGAHEETQTTLDRLELGGVSLNGVPTTATANLSSKAPANVGLQVLSRFRLTIDFAGDRLWLSPYADAKTRPFRKNRAGLSLASENGRLVVDHVARGSPAERGGWRKGEAIAAIDGKPTPGGFAGVEASLFVYGAPGTRVALTLADGTRRTLTLADYY